MIGRVYHLRPGDMELLTFEQLQDIGDDLRRMQDAAAKAAT